MTVITYKTTDNISILLLVGDKMCEYQKAVNVWHACGSSTPLVTYTYIHTLCTGLAPGVPASRPGRGGGGSQGTTASRLQQSAHHALLAQLHGAQQEGHPLLGTLLGTGTGGDTGGGGSGRQGLVEIAGVHAADGGQATLAVARARQLQQA